MAKPRKVTHVPLVTGVGCVAPGVGETLKARLSVPSREPERALLLSEGHSCIKFSSSPKYSCTRPRFIRLIIGLSRSLIYREEKRTSREKVRHLTSITWTVLEAVYEGLGRILVLFTKKAALTMSGLPSSPPPSPRPFPPPSPCLHFRELARTASTQSDACSI